MRHWIEDATGIIVATAVLAASGCGTSTQPSPGGETHVVACDSDDRCTMPGQVCVDGWCRDESNGDGGTIDAEHDAGPLEGGRPDVPLILGECYATDCDSEVTVVPYEPGPTTSCMPTQLGKGTLDWTWTADDVQCDLPPCAVQYGNSFRVEPGGALDLFGWASVANEAGSGLWFGRLSASGEIIESAVVEADAPSRFATSTGYFPLGFDGQGNRFLMLWRRVRPDEDGFEAQLARYDQSDDRRRVLADIGQVLSTDGAVSPSGDVVVELVWNNPNRQHPDFDIGGGLDVARFDANGRLLWNQVQLADVLTVTNLLTVGFDVNEHAIVVMLDQTTANGLQLTNGSLLGGHKHRLAAIDRRGRVTRAWDVADPRESVGWSYAVVSDGSVYATSTPLIPVGALFEYGTPQLERFDASGRSSWVQRIPFTHVEDVLLHVDRAGNAVLVSHDPRDTPTGPVVDWTIIQPDGRTCVRFEVPCASGSTGDVICPGADGRDGRGGKVVEAQDGRFYFAANTESSEVATFGRVTRPQ